MKTHLQAISLILLLFGISGCGTAPVRDLQPIESPEEIIEKAQIKRNNQPISPEEQALGDIVEKISDFVNATPQVIQ
jgi:hypothetical protein